MLLVDVSPQTSSESPTSLDAFLSLSPSQFDGKPDEPYESDSDDVDESLEVPTAPSDHQVNMFLNDGGYISCLPAAG